MCSEDELRREPAGCPSRDREAFDGTDASADVTSYPDQRGRREGGGRRRPGDPKN